MASVALRCASYEDLLALPRNVLGEIIGGELHTQPRPSGPHAAVASLLDMVLGDPFHRRSGGPGGWIILDEPEFYFDTVTRPAPKARIEFLQTTFGHEELGL